LSEDILESECESDSESGGVTGHDKIEVKNGRLTAFSLQSEVLVKTGENMACILPSSGDSDEKFCQFGLYCITERRYCI